MNISNLTLGFVSTNTYFVENDTEMILIDPAGEIDKIDNKIKQ
ncbi:hydroxyacylglutathione hydrolase, partial [Staphylococcus pseudintermedius]